MDYGILIQSAALGVVAGSNSSLKFREANLSKTQISEVVHTKEFFPFSGFC